MYVFPDKLYQISRKKLAVYCFKFSLVFYGSEVGTRFRKGLAENKREAISWSNECALITGALCDTSWWRHQMEAFSVLLVLCEGNPPVTGGLPWKRPVMLTLMFFQGCLNKRLNNHSNNRWFEPPLESLWHHYNVKTVWNLSSTQQAHCYKHLLWSVREIKRIWHSCCCGNHSGSSYTLKPKCRWDYNFWCSHWRELCQNDICVSVNTQIVRDLNK